MTNQCELCYKCEGDDGEEGEGVGGRGVRLTSNRLQSLIWLQLPSQAQVALWVVNDKCT